MMHRRVDFLVKRREVDLCYFCLLHERLDIIGSKPAAGQDFDSVAGMDNQFPYQFAPFRGGFLLAAR